MPPLAFLLSSIALATAFVTVGLFAGRATRGAGEFVVAGRQASVVGVSGVLLGALVGGASTIGTAEMAYAHGLSAAWFTVGAGIGCALLGLLLAGPLRRTRLETIPQFLTAHYGRPVGLIALAGSVAGSFLSVSAQVLSAAALLRVLLPLEVGWAAGIVSALVLGFLVAGGLKSFAALGATKVALLFAVLAACAVRAAGLGATPAHLWATLPPSPFLVLFRGSADAGAALSVIVGVFCTQIYVQGIFAASSEKTARAGALLSAALMPPLGLLGVWIGLAVRAEGVELPAAQALPWFIQAHFPPSIAGLMWTALMLTAVGTAAGLVLGIATNLVRDVYAHLRPGAGTRHLLLASRVAVAFVMALAAVAAVLEAGTPILGWSYLGMGLRGAGAFFPFVLAGVWPGRLPANWALVASAAGLAAVLLWPVLGGPGEPLFGGLGLAGAVTAVGLTRGRAAVRVAACAEGGDGLKGA